MALLMNAGKVRVRDAAGAALVFTPLNEVPPTALLVYLGKTTEATEVIDSGTAICLAVIDKQQAETFESEASRWLSLRSTGAGLSDLEAGLFTQALALNNWHHSHTHCPGCGSETMIEKAGWVRRCKKDNLELFPRTDPAIIVSILDQNDRILLGSQGIWEENRWSVLAGFVEPGESLEAAVVREMNEESGLDVVEPEYIYSQGWPYPYSLMLGFTARADSSQQLKPDGEEIVRLRWFTKEELLAEAANLLLPGRASISRAMIELWFGQEIISASETAGHGKR
ncbi:MAG: NAD(+) diphosphatase [Actinobacteria bacterium]|nr:NAD(+) diphosphatase [Actinomycetota bacterium]